MQVILHSDDFGLAEDLNLGMTAALRAGLLDGVSVLANGIHLENAAAGAGEGATPAPRIAVHLNLSEGPCSADRAAVPWLVDGQGRLRLSFSRCLAGLTLCSPRQRRDRCRQIAIEWRAQIQRVKSAVAPHSVSGLDGHRHVHMLPFLFPVAADLARQERLHFVRVPREALCRPVTALGWLTPVFWSGQIKRAVLRALSLGRFETLEAAGLSAPDGVTGVVYTGQMSRRAIVAAIRAARRRKWQSLEVILHVGRPHSPLASLPRPVSTPRRLRALERAGALERTG